MDAQAQRVKEILAAIKPLAAEYYRLTGKPLGVTGEVAEYVAAEAMGLELVPPRMPGYDAIRHEGEEKIRIQIKGRAYGEVAKPGQRMGSIKKAADCDIVMLVLLDNATLALREIWEAPYPAVTARLALPGSKARERGALGVSEFKKLAVRVWPATVRPDIYDME
jgi:hypothetical protein